MHRGHMPWTRLWLSALLLTALCERTRTADADSADLVVQQVTISAADVDKLAQWYIEHLDFSLAKRFAVGDTQMAWLEIPHFRLALVHVKDSVRHAVPNETLPQYMQNQGYRNLLFYKADFDRALRELSDRGVTFLGPPVTAFPGVRLAYFRDPEGNVLGITQASVPSSGRVPAEIAAQNRAIGQRVDPPASVKAYAPLAQKPPYAEAKITRDISYGTEPRYLLDVFEPVSARPTHGRAVIIFATGGGFTRTEHTPGGELFYDNVMLWAVKHGMVGVNTDRRPFRGNPWQTGPQDTAAIIGWVHSHIADYGGDPSRVVFLAHAYAATQLTSYLAHRDFWPSHGPGIAAVALISPPLNLVPATNFDIPQAPNPMFDSAHSDLEGARTLALPVFIGSAELDPDPQVQSATVLRDQLCAAGRCPTFRRFLDHGHLSVMMSFNTSDESVSGPLLDWLHSVDK
jgi:catechol 2,3-dioxygenase-like lactoylglutathione lyase family enzyme/acetyl esterase/lipase